MAIELAKRQIKHLSLSFLQATIISRKEVGRFQEIYGEKTYLRHPLQGRTLNEELMVFFPEHLLISFINNIIIMEETPIVTPEENPEVTSATVEPTPEVEHSFGYFGKDKEVSVILHESTTNTFYIHKKIDGKFVRVEVVGLSIKE